MPSYALKLQATQFLRGTGLLDAYEGVISKLVTQGWPSDDNVFGHAAHELLRWHSQHKDEYANNMMVNPGSAALQIQGGASSRLGAGSQQRGTNFLDAGMQNVQVDRAQVRQESPSKRAANVLRQTSAKYPELDQAAQLESYKRQVQEMAID